MQTTFIPQNPHPHCYICGESDLEKLDKVCHHCGRAICNQHESTALMLEPLLYNPEFTRLDLQGVTEYKAVHCKECARNHRWRILLLGGLGRLLLLPNLYTRLYISKQQRPALPTLPNIARILLEEALSGQATLDANGKYQSPKAETAKGTIKVLFRFTEQDWRRFKRYCAKYGVKPTETTLMYHAGFALLQNTDNLFLDDSQNAQTQEAQSQEPQNTEAHVLREGTLAFSGHIEKQQFFTDPTPKPNTWEPVCSYTIKRADGKPLPLPIQISPTVKPDGSQQTLELTIQLHPDNPTFTTYETIYLNSVALQAPGELQTATWVWPAAEFTNMTSTTSTPDTLIPVTWHNLEGLKPNEPKVLSVGFAQKLQAAMVLQGKITATFIGTLSGVKGVKLFYPWGQPRTSPRVQLQTKVEVNFTLDLAKVRFQTAHTAPCQFKRTGVVPDHRFINALLRHLSQANYYVRRTVENPPQTPLTNGHLRRYLWDIAGRAYNGVHPIDFHLLITGEESHTGSRPNALEVNITTKAVGAAEIIPAETEKLCENLRTLLEQTVAEI